MSLIRIHQNPSRGQLPALAAGWLVCFAVLSMTAFGRTGSALASGVLGSVAVLAPAVGLLMRLFRYDPMNRRFDPEAETYWPPGESTDDTDRCFRQF